MLSLNHISDSPLNSVMSHREPGQACLNHSLVSLLAPAALPRLGLGLLEMVSWAVAPECGHALSIVSFLLNKQVTPTICLCKVDAIIRTIL